MNQKPYLKRPVPGALAMFGRRTLRQMLLIVLLGIAAVCSTMPAAVGTGAGVHAAGLGTPATGLSTQLDTYLAGLAARGEFSGAVLLARHGTILLRKGYGLADRALHVPNTPETKYPVGGVSSNMSLLMALWMEEHGMLADQARICHYLPRCPAAWKPITIHMLLDGSANIGSFDWESKTGTTARSLHVLQAQPLDGAPGSAFDFQNGDTLVLAIILEKITGQPWATLLQRIIFGPAGMPHSGRMSDASLAPAWAQDYSGRTAVPSHVYNDYFVVYSTVSDVYAYDNALFGGWLIAPSMLRRLFTPLAATSASDSAAMPGIDALHTCYQAWKSGRVFGHPVFLTYNNGYSFYTINMRFPQDGVTLVVTSNDDQNDVQVIAEHLAALAFGHVLAAPGAVMTPAVSRAQADVATIPNNSGFPFAVSAQALWLPNPNDGTVLRIEPTTNRVVATIKVGNPQRDPGGADPFAVAVGDGQVWATDRADRAIVRIDPATNKVIGKVKIGILTCGLAIAGHTLWASADPYQTNPDTVVRVDLQTMKVAAVLHGVGAPYFSIAASPDALWIVSHARNRVERISATTNRVVAAIDTGGTPESLAVGDGAVWVADRYGQELSRIDPRTNRIVATIPFALYAGNKQDCPCQNVAVGAGAVWAVASTSTLLRIDPRINRAVAALTFARAIANVGFGAGSVWVDSYSPPNQLDRVAPQAMR